MLGTKTRLTTLVAIGLIAAVLPVLAGTRIERSFDLAPGGGFTLDTDVGTVEIRGTAGSKARVVITSRLDDLESRFVIRFEPGPDHLSVEVDKKGGLSWFNWGRSGGLRFEIEVPHNTRISIDTSGGSITAEAIHNETRLDTSGGSIRAKDIGGHVNADTSGGSIYLEHIDGDAVADTSGGRIEANDVRGNLRADTSGGSISASDVDGDVRADTSGGSISLTGMGGHVVADTSGGSIRASFNAGNSRGGSLSTSGGGIRVKLDAGANLDINAASSGGSVVSDVPITVQGRISKSSLQGKMGSGGAELRLRTSGGGIRIEPL